MSNKPKLLTGDDLRRAAEQAARLITVNESVQMQPVIARAIDAINEVARHGEIASAKRVIASCQETIDRQRELLAQLNDVGP